MVVAGFICKFARNICAVAFCLPDVSCASHALVLTSMIMQRTLVTAALSL